MDQEPTGPAQQPAEQYKGQPFPTPMLTSVEPGRDNAGNAMLRVSYYGPNGTWVAFMGPAEAEAFGQRLIDAARFARTGLVTATQLPTGGLNARPV